MPGVLISTDFSEACCHGVDYACTILQGKDVTLDLVHIFPVPVTYTTDGMALVSLRAAIDRAEDMLEDEVARVKKTYPGMRISGRLITGSFLNTLRQEALRTQPLFIVLGTAGFADLYLGDNDPLNALRSIPAPVLFVPKGVSTRPIKEIAYACNYAYAGPQIPADEMSRWLQFMDARLQIVHTAPESEANATPRQQEGEAWVRHAFEPQHPAFRWIQDADLIHGLTSFISNSNIDCLMVVPRRYGIWQNMFHDSRTKALARLNKVPVIAFHEKQ